MEKESFKDYIEEREGFRLVKDDRIAHISLMNYFFFAGDILIVSASSSQRLARTCDRLDCTQLSDLADDLYMADRVR